MLIKRILKNLRLIVLITLGLTVGIVLGGVYYLNQTGVNRQWRDNIAQELENLGIIADFDSLRYIPSRGLVAEGVTIYADSSRTETIAQLENLVIDVDKTKLMRGKLRVNNISLINAEISLPLDPDDPDGPRIIINKLSGDMYLPDKNTIEAREISGMVAGIQLSLDAHIWSENLKKIQTQSKNQKKARITRIKVIAKIIEEISHWNWPEGKPPQLKIYAEGNIDNLDSSHLDFSLTADELEHKGIKLHHIDIRGDYNNKMITVDRISLQDGSGKLEALADFHPATRQGKFKVTESTLHLQMLARQLLGIKPIPQVVFSTPPSITCSGSLSFDSSFTPTIQLSGQAETLNFSYLGTRFKRLETELSIQGKNVFLTGLRAVHTDGEITGRVLLKDGIIRFEADTTLPAKAYLPFILNPIAKREMGRATFTSASRVHVISKGFIDTTQPKKWSITGHAQLQNFSYKNVAMKEAEASYLLKPQSLDFSKIKLTFDYRNYSLRQQYGGPLSGRVNADKVVIDLKDRMVHIHNVRTTSWPVPVIRLFHERSAKHCERYRFMKPPNLFANGSFDLNRTQARTDFKINLNIPGTTHYTFLGETLTVRRLRGDVRIRQDRVDVTKLSFSTFQGACNGEITVHPKKRTYNGSFHGSRIHFKDLGETYHFNKAESGLITGRLEFNGRNSDIRTFNGKGAVGLERGNLFSIPMLGPLSPLVTTVLGKKNIANEHAENASFTYAIRNGVVYSDNFQASTKSLRFTGEGNIDLSKKEINLMIRMNAQGLFSILTLPLKPFMGLFQFNGTGKISKPQWKTSIFTTPKRGKKDPIFRRPPKARVIRE